MKSNKMIRKGYEASSAASIDPIMVAGQNELNRLARKIKQEGLFAIDTEFVMEDVHEPEICLVQLATPDQVFLIDALDHLDIAPIWDLVADPDVETVVHAGQEDLAACVHATGNAPRHVFDVQIAAGLVGPTYPISLSRLVQQCLHLRIHKSQTLTDWRRRPLTAEQVQYATQDVAYLPAIRKSLIKKMTELGRADWARQEFQRCENPSIYQRTAVTALKKVKGVGSLSERQLFIASEVAEWRHQLAKTLNKPARTLLKDHLLVEIARQALHGGGQIGSLRGLNLRREHLDELNALVKRALENSADKSDKVKYARGRPETPQEAVLLHLLTAIIRHECDRLNLAYSLLTTRKNVQEILNLFLDARRRLGHPSPDLLKGWRGEAVGGAIQKVLEGAVGIYIDTDDRKSLLKYFKTPSDAD